MNAQEILGHGPTRLDSILDNSEFYDYELFEIILGKVDAVLDNSELYDYELVNITLHKLDVVLDKSEVYDYVLGNNTTDYTIPVTKAVVTTYYLLTEDAFVIITEDDYRLRYI
jgi:hypothetical protein